MTAETVGTAEVEAVEIKKKYIFGNYHTENVVLPDLEIGPASARQAFKLEPGEVANLGKYFKEEELERSLSLDLALENEWLKPCELSTVIEVLEHRLPAGTAPPNAFDRRLREELIKERQEEERLKAGRDGLAARVMDAEEK